MGLAGLLGKKPRRISTESTVMDACALMDEEKVGAVAITEDGRVQGIFTYRDLVARVLLEKRDITTTRLGEVMTRDVDVLDVGASHGDALRLMIENDYTYLPIVSEGGTLSGILPMRRLFEHRIDELAAELDSVTNYFGADGAGGD